MVNPNVPAVEYGFPDLLKMEQSALETYSQAVEFYREDPVHSMLMAIRSAHEENLEVLLRHSGSCGEGEPGVPDGFSGAVESTSMIFGESAGLMALEAGEAETANAYATASAGKSLPESLRTEILDVVLPRLRGNLADLENARSEEP